MPQFLDWQTEDEEEWHDQSGFDTTDQNTRKWSFNWRFILIGILTLVVAALTVNLRIQKTLKEAEATRTADILTSFELLETAIQTNDKELFDTLLSGADDPWADAQQELFNKGWFHDRRSFGLGSTPSVSSSPTITLDPKLNSALLAAEYHYPIVDADGVERIIRLRRDFVFRLGSRWLLAPPRDEFWGASDDIDKHGQMLSMQFPERDQEILEPIFQKIDKGLVEICQSIESISCPSNLKVEILFSRDPGSLLVLNRSYLEDGFTGKALRKPGSNLRLSLPAPSLVGIPMDQISLQAVSQAYAAYVTESIMSQYLDQACCADDDLLRGMILDRLFELKLRPWPIEQPLVKAAASIDLGNYELHLMCHNQIYPTIDVVSLHSNTGKWQLTLGNRPIVDMKSLPDGRGLAMLENVEQDEVVLTRLLIYDGHEESVLSEQYLPASEARATRFEIRDRVERLILETPRLSEGFSDFTAFNLNGCGSSACEMGVYSLSGRPFWSPDGSQWLVREFGQLWKHQDYLSFPISDGFAPFWIDDKRFGFVRQIGDEQFIVMRTSDTDDQQIVIPLDPLIEELPNLTRGSRVKVGLVLPDPAKPESHWFLLAFLMLRTELQEAIILDYDVATGKAHLLVRSSQLNKVAISPRGGSVAFALYNELEQHWQILISANGKDEEYLHTLTTGSSLSNAPSLAWSPDNNRLAVLHNGIATIISLENRESFDIVPPSSGCVTAAWMAPIR